MGKLIDRKRNKDTRWVCQRYGRNFLEYDFFYSKVIKVLLLSIADFAYYIIKEKPSKRFYPHLISRLSLLGCILFFLRPLFQVIMLYSSQIIIQFIYLWNTCWNFQTYNIFITNPIQIFNQCTKTVTMSNNQYCFVIE